MRPTYVQRAFTAGGLRVAKAARPAFIEVLNYAIKEDKPANKVITETKTLDTQFVTWARHYFSTVSGNSSTGIPTTAVIAAAKAEFVGTDKLIEKAIRAGILVRPKSYSLCFANLDLD